MRWILTMYNKDKNTIKCILRRWRGAADLEGEDEGLIDTKGLLRGDKQGGGAREGARGEGALIVHLRHRRLVGAPQHPVRQAAHAVSGCRGRWGTHTETKEMTDRGHSVGLCVLKGP